MALISFKNLGAKGLVTDMAPNELPLDAWSGAKNVRFTPLGVERTLGNQAVYGTPSTEPLQAFRTAIGATPVWSYWGVAKAYCTDGTTQYDITRATGGDYTVDTKRKWTGGNFNGLVIANNSYDVPQSWAPSVYSTKAQDLANWPASLRCKVLRPFGNVLVALDLTLSGTNKPAALRWSHPADPGSVPASWDIADQTKDAGEAYLNETPGRLTDLVSLRNDGILYKFDSIHRMQYVGGAYIYKFSKISTTVGMPTTRCAVEVRPGVHIFWSGDDVLMFDGQNFQSVIESKLKRWLQNIPETTYESAFMVNNPTKSEVWLCWPENELNFYRATKALILNWQTGAWGIRELGTTGFSFITTGPVDPVTSTTTDDWTTDSQTWDDDSFVWGEARVARSSTRLLGGTQAALTMEDYGYQFNSAPFESYAERVAFGIPFDQQLPPDISSWKFCREVWPRVTGDPGTELQVTIGSMSEIGDNVVWEPPQTFIIGQDVKVNCTTSGRMFALRFGATGNGNWTLHGYDLEVQKSGGY